MNAESTETVRDKEIAAMIHSDSSPVGIDARKTHVIIIRMLMELDERMSRLESGLEQLAQSLD